MPTYLKILQGLRPYGGQKDRASACSCEHYTPLVCNPSGPSSHYFKGADSRGLSSASGASCLGLPPSSWGWSGVGERALRWAQARASRSVFSRSVCALRAQPSLWAWPSPLSPPFPGLQAEAKKEKRLESRGQGVVVVVGPECAAGYKGRATGPESLPAHWP